MAGSSALPAAGLGAVLVLLASPYLAHLAVSVPDRSRRDWWRAPDRRILPTSAPAPLPTAAALTGLVTGAGFTAAAGLTAATPAFVLVALIAVPLVLIDVAHQRLPDRLLGPGAVAGVVLLALAALPGGQWHRYGIALLCGAAVFALFALMWFAVPRSLGFGDAKLAGWLALHVGWFGPAAVVLGVAAGFVIGALVAVVWMVAGRAGWRSHLPFGPMLIAGAMVGALIGSLPG